MPYPRAFYYMLGVVGVILIGFWPSYFAAGPTTVPWQFHAHGMAASLWVLLVTGQCWTSQHKNQLQLHRSIGKASLFLFPFLIAGLAAITSLQSKNWVAREPLHLLYGPGFMIGTMVAMAAYVTVYYRALKYRRKVWVPRRLHAVDPADPVRNRRSAGRRRSSSLRSTSTARPNSTR